MIAKLSSDGKIEWTKFFAEGTFVTVDQLSIDKKNELYLSGFSNFPSKIGKTSYKAVDENGLESDKFIAKMSTTGNFLWEKNYTTIFKTKTVENLITSNVKDGMYLCTTYSNNSDIVVSTIAANGNILWTKKIGKFLDNKGNIKSITSDKLGNIYIMHIDISVAQVASYENLFVVKINPSGAVVWSKNVDSKGIESSTQGKAITVDKLGNIWLLGHINGETTIGKTKINTAFQNGAPFLIKMK